MSENNKKHLTVLSTNSNVVEKVVDSKDYEKQTQAYSTFGDKLLQHADVLYSIQKDKIFKPITIQLGPTEACDSNCPFCSVGWRDITKKIPFETIKKLLSDFKELGAKSLEITGSGNPLIYKDGDKNINHIIEHAYSLGYDIGIITNTENLPRHLTKESMEKVQWIRVSLIKLDEGKVPEDYKFGEMNIKKLGFSYIIYEGTTKESIQRIAKLVELHPDIKFVRIAADCLTDKSITVKKEWGEVISTIDQYNKFFIKEINDNFHAYKEGCYVGLVRPYVVWNGVYYCTSHVLKHRNYHPTWKLCDHNNIQETWTEANRRFQRGLSPYIIDIEKECKHCYYHNNNQLLHTVATDLPDKNFA